MSTLAADLRDVAQSARAEAARFDAPDIGGPVAAVDAACRSIGEAWSGSHLGFHSCVYYSGLNPPPPGAHFDAEWGFLGAFHGTTGDWEELEPATVKAAVWTAAGVDDLSAAKSAAAQAAAAFEAGKAEAVSILSTHLATDVDPLIADILDAVQKLRVPTEVGTLSAIITPGGAIVTRDTTALSQGFQPAPHEEIAVQAFVVEKSFAACGTLGTLSERGAAHIERQARSRSVQGQAAVSAGAGTRVFIGHGRSPLWRELKDFVRDRLGLEHDEFNRVPVAGVTNIARLSEMLDNAAIAFIVLTAEDQTIDGEHRARENVVHEAGLFQGRLGFGRAILLLEEGCNEFSNVQGLGQIRFPAGNIAACFEAVREVLEREGIIEP